MKRFLSIALLVWMSGVLALKAQDASARADHQAAEERYQQLMGKFQDLQETQQAQSRRIETLMGEIRSLRDEMNKPETDKVQREEVRKLAEQLKEVDEKRAADKDAILKAIAKLGAAPPPAATLTTKPVKASSKPKADASQDSAGDSGAADKNYEGYEHEVMANETLSAIVRAYNKEYGLHLTIDQVIKHPLNSKLVVEKLRVGQKVFIPAK